MPGREDLIEAATYWLTFAEDVHEKERLESARCGGRDMRRGTLAEVCEDVAKNLRKVAGDECYDAVVKLNP